MFMIRLAVREGRVVGPGHAGIEASNARPERAPVLVEDRELVLLRHFVLEIAVGIQDRYRLAGLGVVAASGAHPMADVVGQRLQPPWKRRWSSSRASR